MGHHCLVATLKELLVVHGDSCQCCISGCTSAYECMEKMRHLVTLVDYEIYLPCGGASLIKLAATCGMHCAIYQYASISNTTIGSCISRMSHLVGITIGASIDGLIGFNCLRTSWTCWRLTLTNATNHLDSS